MNSRTPVLFDAWADAAKRCRWLDDSGIVVRTAQRLEDDPAAMAGRHDRGSGGDPRRRRRTYLGGGRMILSTGRIP
jgi:hypothetical protein